MKKQSRDLDFILYRFVMCFNVALTLAFSDGSLHSTSHSRHVIYICDISGFTLIARVDKIFLPNIHIKPLQKLCAQSYLTCTSIHLCEQIIFHQFLKKCSKM